jgi:DNA polymerase delta subunit 1
VELYKKLDVFNNAMAMANACSVPVGYIFTRGQGIKIESLIFKECYERNQCVLVLPTTPRGAPLEQQDSYEGAIVLTPEPGFYFKSPVGVADFASLYPSTIISENISYDSLVWVKEFDLDGNIVKTTMLGDQFAYILTQKSHSFLEKFKLTEAKKQAEKILTEIMKLERMLKDNEHFNES